MEKKNRLKELNKERKALWDRIDEINREIDKVELGDCDYTGKYIFIPDYGFMHVTWQKYEERNPIDGREKMFFQGFAFEGSASDYRDDFWMYSSALHEWNIPYSTFKSYVTDGEIKEITKEEFIERFKKNSDEFLTKWQVMLGKSEKHIHWNDEEKDKEKESDE